MPAPETPQPRLRNLRQPIWTENKARLIERYLYYFVLITKHGTYIDGFAGPQSPGVPESWAAKLVLESEPRWFRHFYLFEAAPAQFEQLCKLREDLTASGALGHRTVVVCQGDCNLLIPQLLASNNVGEKEATFCLLDQRTFECHWCTLEALARHKRSGHKIELFYFLAARWIDRAQSATRNEEMLRCWWGRDDWRSFFSIRNSTSRAKAMAERFRSELGYQFAVPFPIYERKDGGPVMYFMIHASDHPEAPNLMRRAYERAVTPREPSEQLEMLFSKLQISSQERGDPM